MIEKGGNPPGSYAGGDNPPGDSPEGGDMDETASIPLSMLGGQQVKPGDVIRLKVVSIDSDSGAVTVAYEHGDEAPAGGSDDMASEFDKPAETVTPGQPAGEPT